MIARSFVYSKGEKVMTSREEKLHNRKLVKLYQNLGSGMLMSLMLQPMQRKKGKTHGSNTLGVGRQV